MTNKEKLGWFILTLPFTALFITLFAIVPAIEIFIIIVVILSIGVTTVVGTKLIGLNKWQLTNTSN